MGSSYQTILATGTLDDVRAAVAESGQAAVVMPVGEHRWAVVPEDDDGYSHTDDLARLLSRPPGTVAAAFDVFDSVVLTTGLFRAGRSYHDYLSDQSYLEPGWDEDDNEILFDLLGRIYPPGATPPAGAFGADPEAFTPFATGPVDDQALTHTLSAENLRAEERHHDLLQQLRIDPKPLRMTYAEAAASGLGV